MKRKILNYFEIAARTAKSKSDIRYYLVGAVGVRSDGTMVKSLNSPTETPNRIAHAEYKLCKKLDTQATVYIARVRLDNFQFTMSKPCKNCMKRLRSLDVEKIYYTIDGGHYGMINRDGVETIHKMRALSVNPL